MVEHHVKIPDSPLRAFEGLADLEFAAVAFVAQTADRRGAVIGAVDADIFLVAGLEVGAIAGIAAELEAERNGTVVICCPFPPRITPGHSLISHCTVTVCIFTGPVTRTFSGRDKGADFLTPQFIVTEPGVVSAVCRCCPDFSVSLPDKTREGF
ncbi:hypothetical protein E3AUHO_50880 [Klebsiella pneumoniae subsp. pneumoniae]|nr:hypothetical protein E3AUHO_50880 [Klebsiella pneumoniae subsp. pneumoniae]